MLDLDKIEARAAAPWRSLRVRVPRIPKNHHVDSRKLILSGLETGTYEHRRVSG